MLTLDRTFRFEAPRSRRLPLMAVLVGLYCPFPVMAGDWPQILGPHRDGTAGKESLVDSLPADGPKTVWERSVGSGYAGVSIAGGTCVLFHRVGDQERVEAMDARTGRVKWTANFPATYVPSFNDDDGPLCAPVIEGDMVYVFGAMARLHAIDLVGGKTKWSRDAFKDFSAGRGGGEPPEGYFGHGSSPIVVGDAVVVNVGGAKQGGVVAFDSKTGKTLWAATSDRASYSSPVLAAIDGVPHLIAVTRLKCVSLDPATGAVRWEMPFGKRGPTVNGANPTVVDGRLFLTASYGIGAVYAKIGKDAVETIWQSDDICSSQYATCVEDNGLLFGLHGRQDLGQASLVCFDPKTEKVQWSKDRFGYGSLIKADGKLVIFTTRGELVLAKPDAEEYVELSRATILDGTTRALPALSNGLFYARNQKTLKCVDLGRPISK